MSDRFKDSKMIKKLCPLVNANCISTGCMLWVHKNCAITLIAHAQIKMMPMPAEKKKDEKPKGGKKDGGQSGTDESKAESKQSVGSAATGDGAKDQESRPDDQKSE